MPALSRPANVVGTGRVGSRCMGPPASTTTEPIWDAWSATPPCRRSRRANRYRDPSTSQCSQPRRVQQPASVARLAINDNASASPPKRILGQAQCPVRDTGWTGDWTGIIGRGGCLLKSGVDGVDASPVYAW